MALLRPSPGLPPADNYLRFGRAFEQIDANTDRIATIPDLVARILRINAGLYPSERPGDNPTAFTASRAGGDPDSLAPLDTAVYPVRVVGDGLGVEVSGSREVWERTLHAVEDTRLWLGRWRYVRTQPSQDPSGDSIVAQGQWYAPDRTTPIGGPVQIDAAAPGVGLPYEFSAIIGPAGVTGVTVPKPPGALYMRCGFKSYGIEGRTVLTDLAAIDVSAVNRLIAPTAQGLQEEAAARQAGDDATRALAAADVEWPSSFYRTYTIAADGTGDFPSAVLAIAAIQNLPADQKPSATRLYLLKHADGQWGDVNVQPQAYVYMEGNGPGRSVFFCDLPVNTALSTIATTNILRLSARNRIRGFSVWIRNGEAAIRHGAIGDNPGTIVRMEDMDVRHLGNDGARAWQAANGGNPAAVSTAERALFFFGASGQYWLLDRCSFVSRNEAAIHGQNSPGASAGIRVIARNCRSVSEVRRTAGAIGFSLRLDSHGSRQRDTFEMIGCELSGAIATTASPWLATRPQDQVADRAEWRVSGAGCTPVPYAVYDDGARALRLTSASTEPYSAIRVDGNAVPLILGTPSNGAGLPEGIVLRPGAVGVQGDLYGTLDVGDHLVGGDFAQDITRLGYRLGDCRGAPKTLTATTDKSSATVTFNQDYRNQSNAAILAVINAALAGVATADLLWVTELHRPEWRDQQDLVYNGGSTTIRRKRAVALTGDDRTVRVMTPTDQSVMFGGLALEDIRPGDWGRVQIGGALNADADLERAVAETIVQGGTMGVVDASGRWGVAAAYPLLQAENLIELRFLPRDQSTRTAVRPYASFTAFGDSISAMTGASDPSLGWVPRLGRYLHLAPRNFAVGGAETADQQPFAYQQIVSPTGAQLFTFATGTNEGLANTPSQTERQDTFVGLHSAPLAWLAIPESNKWRGQQRLLTFSVTSLTHDGAGGLATVATATTSTAHGLTSGRAVQISGAAQAEYNVLAQITVTGPSTFTFPIAGTPATPAVGTITATTQGMAYTGTWADEAGYFGGAMSVRSSTQGSTAQWDTWGDVAYLAYGVQVGDPGRFDVYVDGALAGSYRSDGPGGGMSTTYVHGTSHGSCLVRLSGLGRRRHTIRVVVTSATGAGRVWLDWGSVRPVGGAAHLAGPTVLVGGTPITQDVDFGGNIYASLARVNAEALAGDGLNIAFVDTAAYMDYATDISPDRLHPNSTGHLHIYEAFRAALGVSALSRPGSSAGLFEAVDLAKAARDAARAAQTVAEQRASDAAASATVSTNRAVASNQSSVEAAAYAANAMAYAAQVGRVIYDFNYSSDPDTSNDWNN